jgi:hypothetical protein
MIVAILLGAAMLIPTAARADTPDQSGEVERIPMLSASVFADDGLIVLTGPPLEQGCFGQGFMQPLAKVVTFPDGATETTSTFKDHAWVFDDEGFDNPLDWLFGVACAAVMAGEPAPDSLAHGEAVIQVNGSTDADGVGDLSSSLKAIVTTADGQDVRLNAFGIFGENGDIISYGG